MSTRDPWSGSSVRTEPARRRRCGSPSACSPPTPARSDGEGGRWTGSLGVGSATSRRSVASTRRCASSTSSSTWRGSTVRAGPPRDPRFGDPRDPRSGRPLEGPGRELVAREPAAGATRRRPRLRARSPRARRAVLGLDPVGTDVLIEVLDRERVSRGVPIVFSSHQLELVERVCDRVVMIVDGRIVADGAIDELRASRARRLVRVEVSGPRPTGTSRSPACGSTGRFRRGSSSSSNARRTISGSSISPGRSARSGTSAGFAPRCPSCSGR